MQPRFRITLAHANHLPALPGIEREAAALLADHAVPAALTETTPMLELVEAKRDGRLWVALDAENPVGFALVALLDDGTPHLQEMDVSPMYMRQGIGSALVQAVLSWARQRGIPLTLTTFRDVPFNAPFYARRGFTVVNSIDWTPAVTAIVNDEHARGLDRVRRVVMQYPPFANGELGSS